MKTAMKTVSCATRSPALFFVHWRGQNISLARNPAGKIPLFVVLRQCSIALHDYQTLYNSIRISVPTKNKYEYSLLKKRFHHNTEERRLVSRNIVDTTKTNNCYES